jgi:hypothetical protein
MAGAIIFHPADESVGFTTTDELAVGLHLDIENDTLYFTDGSLIHEWEGDSGTQQTYTWKSGKIRTKRPINLGAALVEATAYSDLTFKLYADISNTMTLKKTQTVTSSEPFRLPGGYLSAIYEIELTGTERVESVRVGESILDLDPR